MLSSFIDTFSFINFPKNLKEELKGASVKRCSLNEKSGILKIELVLNKVLEKRVLTAAKNLIKNEHPELLDVLIEHEYQIEDNSLENIVNKYKTVLIEEIKEKSPAAGLIIEEADWKTYDNHIDILINYDILGLLKHKNLDNFIREKFLEHFKLAIFVNFIENGITKTLNNEEKLSKIIIESQKNNNLLEAEVLEEDMELKSEKKERIGKILFGRAIKEITANTINSVNIVGDTVVVKGEVIKLDYRELQNDCHIVSIDLSDKSSSITVKSFIANDIFYSIKDYLQEGEFVKVKGILQYDKFLDDNVIMTRQIEKSEKAVLALDHASKKRVELHLHTKMSAMDAVSSTEEYFNLAKQYGHKAIAITDHGVVQAFPDAMRLSKETGIKAIYGMEGYIVDDLNTIVENHKDQKFDGNFIAFDTETTGLKAKTDTIIEIGAVRFENFEAVASYNSLVNPKRFLQKKIIEITGINDSMLKDERTIDEVFPEFLDFIKDSVLLAHNSSFDMGFIRNIANVLGYNLDNTVIDSLELMRTLYPELKKHTLDASCLHLGISLENHHRADSDAKACGEILLKTKDILYEKKIEKLEDLNFLASKRKNFNRLRSSHICLLAKNSIGLKNLYELISESHIDNFYRQPRIVKSSLIKKREGLLIGTACSSGELYKAILNSKPQAIINDICRLYDYFEIQPISNNNYMIRDKIVESVDDLKEINKQIYNLGQIYNKTVVAASDAHFAYKEQEIFRKIILAGKQFKDVDEDLPLYYRTTEDMLKEFSYLGDKIAYELVVENTNKIADEIEHIEPILSGTYTPKIEGADDKLLEITYKTARDIYGNELPKVVEDRLKRELSSIIDNGFSVMYIMAKDAVDKSVADGYLVGSRGSVGSSLVATMTNITEVNPLSAHYLCKNCKFSDFDSEIVVKYSVFSGFDLPDRVCPICGENLLKEGHNIHFETFLGFNGDKEPDIDLNFSGEYQQNIHTYTEETFGKNNVFKAGTIGTLAEKNAYGYVRKYLDERGLNPHKAEVNRLVKGCTGVKKSTGQHPGGLIIVPKENDIHQFTPVQKPANKMDSDVTTTHFDFNFLAGKLLKLDLLGHDDPTMLKMLEDLTGLDPRDIPFDEEKTLSLFTSLNALGLKENDIGTPVGTLAVPEFGTRFVRQMLVETKPTKFSELLRISGLSHGTNVWHSNAQELIKNGQAQISNVISARDDIMVYLIEKGLDKLHAFTIMENVRKGKGLREEDLIAMKENNVENWYIESCKKIKYLFPKAHATAYVMMAFRIAYYKVYYPESFYTAFFSLKLNDFNYKLMCRGRDVVLGEMQRIKSLGNEAKDKEQKTFNILEVVNEMYARGIKFKELDIYKSESKKFLLIDNEILPALSTIEGLGENAADTIIKARKDGKFKSIEEFRIRTSVNKTCIEYMKDNAIFGDLPSTNQISLF